MGTLYSTNPGDPALNEWTERSADMSSYIGQTVRIGFVVQHNLGWFDVHLDNIDLETYGNERTAEVPLAPADVSHVHTVNPGHRVLTTVPQAILHLSSGDHKIQVVRKLDNVVLYDEVVSLTADRGIDLVMPPLPARLSLQPVRVPMGSTVADCVSPLSVAGGPTTTYPEGLLAVDVVLTSQALSSGAQFTLSYDPAIFTMLDMSGQPADQVIPCGALGQVITNTVNGNTGRVEFAAIVNGTPLSAGVPHVLARLVLRANQASSGSELDFLEHGVALIPMVTAPGSVTNQLHAHTDATVRVQAGVPVGMRVRLQRGTGTADARARLVRVRVFQVGNTRFPVAKRDVVTDANGRFEAIIDGLSESASYFINVQAPRSLSKQLPYVHGRVLDFVLPVGDANGDDVVNILDFAVLAREFGRTNEMLLRADFNEDSNLNVMEYSLLIAGNFGQYGPLAGTWQTGPNPVDLTPPAILVRSPSP